MFSRRRRSSGRPSCGMGATRCAVARLSPCCSRRSTLKSSARIGGSAGRNPVGPPPRERATFNSSRSRTSADRWRLDTTGRYLCATRRPAGSSVSVAWDPGGGSTTCATISEPIDDCAGGEAALRSPRAPSPNQKRLIKAGLGGRAATRQTARLVSRTTLGRSGDRLAFPWAAE